MMVLSGLCTLTLLCLSLPEVLMLLARDKRHFVIIILALYPELFIFHNFSLNRINPERYD